MRALLRGISILPPAFTLRRAFEILETVQLLILLRPRRRLPGGTARGEVLKELVVDGSVRMFLGVRFDASHLDWGLDTW